MSEFSASAGFLDKDGLYPQYWSIVSTIENERRNISDSIRRLNRFRGFGLEEYIRELENHCETLKNIQNDVTMEWNSLRKIIETVNEGERRAIEVLGGENGSAISKMNDYSYSDENTSNPNPFFDFIYKLFGKCVEDMDAFGYLDYVDGAFDFIYEVNGKDYEGLPISEIKMLKDIWDIINGLMGNDSDADYISLFSKLGKDFLKSFKDILSRLKDAGFAIDESDLGELNVVGVVLSTLISGYDSYKKYSADGEFDLNDGCLTAMEASVDGLFTCVEALINLIPGAGKALSKALGFADDTFDLSDYVKNGIKDFADDTAEDIRNTIAQNEYLKSIKNSSPVASVLVRVMLLNPWARDIFKTYK